MASGCSVARAAARAKGTQEPDVIPCTAIGSADTNEDRGLRGSPQRSSSEGSSDPTRLAVLLALVDVGVMGMHLAPGVVPT